MQQRAVANIANIDENKISTMVIENLIQLVSKNESIQFRECECIRLRQIRAKSVGIFIDDDVHEAPRHV